MRRRREAFEVFSMSAIDLFASAMGAFIIISIILMPDYQKEVRAEGDSTLLETLFADSEDALEDIDDATWRRLRSRQRESRGRRQYLLDALEDLETEALRIGSQLKERASEEFRAFLERLHPAD